MTIRVRAKARGIYPVHVRRKPGDVFEVASERELGAWMERIDEGASESGGDEAPRKPEPVAGRRGSNKSVI